MKFQIEGVDVKSVKFNGQPIKKVWFENDLVFDATTNQDFVKVYSYDNFGARIITEDYSVTPVYNYDKFLINLPSGIKRIIKPPNTKDYIEFRNQKIKEIEITESIYGIDIPLLPSLKKINLGRNQNLTVINIQLSSEFEELTLERKYISRFALTEFFKNLPTTSRGKAIIGFEDNMASDPLSNFEVQQAFSEAKNRGWRFYKKTFEEFNRI